METGTLEINLNFSGLWGKYFINLQHFLDVINFLQCGANSVDEKIFSESDEFVKFYPAKDMRRSFDETKKYALSWLIKAFLRDSIEMTGLFLDESLTACALLKLASKKMVTGGEVNDLFNVVAKKNHKLPFPEKIKKLENDFSVTSPHSAHALSINKVRTCVVHRLGAVSKHDTDGREALILMLKYMNVFTVNPKTKEEVAVRRGMLILEGWGLHMRFDDKEKRFKLGETVDLEIEDIYACIATFYLFASSITEAVAAYGQSLGLDIKHEPAPV